jgi:hypothetical protein
VEFERKSVVVDGLVNGYLEAGAGDRVVLLRGGEFGACAEIGWERIVGMWAGRHRVLALDRSLALICGGGAIERNQHADVLYDYDGSFEAMFRRPGVSPPPKPSTTRVVGELLLGFLEGSPTS